MNLPENKKRVLCILYHFPPLGGIPVMRSLRLVKYLSKFNWQPIVLTSRFGYDNIQGTDVSLMEQLPQKLKIIRVNDTIGKLLNLCDKKLSSFIMYQLDRLSKVLFFPDEKLVWSIMSVIKYRASIKSDLNIDLIYASGFPWSSLLLGYWLKKYTNRPLILDFRDGWSISPNPLWRRFYFHRKMERKIIEAADKVIFATEGLRTEYAKQYPNFSRKFKTIYNGFDPDFFPVEIAKKRLRRSSQMKLLYAGSLSDSIPPKNRSRTIIPLLNGLNNIKNRHPEIYEKISFEVYSNDIPNTRKFILNESLSDKVTLRSKIGYKEIIGKMFESDVLLLIVMNDIFSKYIAPAKLYEYIAVGKPILALTPAFSEAFKIIQKYKLGSIVTYENLEEDLVDKLSRLIDGNDHSQNGIFREAQHVFNGKKLVGEFAFQFNSVIN